MHFLFDAKKQAAHGSSNICVTNQMQDKNWYYDSENQLVFFIWRKLTYDAKNMLPIPAISERSE